MAVRIKICGITSLKEAEEAVAAGADALGFVFAKGAHQISPEDAHHICEKLPPFISRVGVFVNSPKYEVMEIATLCHLDALQFHGDETPAFCKGYSQQVIKSFRVKDAAFLGQLSHYQVNAYLLDTYIAGQSGGTGETFDWELAEAARKIANNVILSGGLNPDNVVEAVQRVRPYAVDASSGLEMNGKKDYYLMRKFIEELRRVECPR